MLTQSPRTHLRLAAAALLLGSLASGLTANHMSSSVHAASVGSSSKATPSPRDDSGRKDKGEGEDRNKKQDEDNDNDKGEGEDENEQSQPKECDGRGYHRSEKRCETDVNGGQGNFWTVNTDGSIDWQRPATQRHGDQFGTFLPVIFTPADHNVLASYNSNQDCFTIVSDPTSQFGPVAVDVTQDQYYLLPKPLPKNAPITYCKTPKLVKPLVFALASNPVTALSVDVSRGAFNLRGTAHIAPNATVGGVTTIAPNATKSVTIGGLPANSEVSVVETLAVPTSTKSGSAVIYSHTADLKADKHGVARSTLRDTYGASKMSWAMLTVTVTSGKLGTLTHSVPVILQPLHKVTKSSKTTSPAKK